MGKKTKPLEKKEKKHTKPRKPESGNDDAKSVSLEQLMGALMKVPIHHARLHSGRKLAQRGCGADKKPKEKPPILPKPPQPKQRPIPLSESNKDIKRT